MNIKVKDLSFEEGEGYINFTLVIDNKEEIKCTAMHRDVVTEKNVSDDIFDLIYKFGDKIRDKIRQNANDFLCEFEGRQINSEYIDIL